MTEPPPIAEPMRVLDYAPLEMDSSRAPIATVIGGVLISIVSSGSAAIVALLVLLLLDTRNPHIFINTCGSVGVVAFIVGLLVTFHFPRQ